MGYHNLPALLVSSGAVGYSRDAVGYSSGAVGYSSGAVGYSHDAVGYHNFLPMLVDEENNQRLDP